MPLSLKERSLQQPLGKEHKENEAERKFTMYLLMYFLVFLKFKRIYKLAKLLNNKYSSLIAYIIK